MSKKEELKKPFSLMVDETEKNIIGIINNSGLPAFCLKKVLQNIYEQIVNIDLQEIKQYEEKIKESDK